MRKRTTKEPLVPGYMIPPIIATLVCNHLAYFTSRCFTSGLVHYDLTIVPDDFIPFLPWTIVIYWGCYLYWVVNYICGCRQKKDDAYRFMSADFFSKLICLVFFCLLPTTNVRPEIVGNGIFDNLMRLLYRVDAADNLFPSIHCSTSWLCYIAVRGNPKIPYPYRIASFVITMAICISTLTTKQHVIIDVIGGIAFAELSFYLVKKTGFAKLYRRLMEKIGKHVEQKN